MKRVEIVLLVISLVACERSPIDTPSVSGTITVEKVEAFSNGQVLTVSIKNTGNDDLVIRNCLGALDLGVQRQSGTTWTEVYRADYSMCLSEPIVIRPKTTYASLAGVGIPSPGVYRVFLYNLTTSTGSPAPDVVRASSEFNVVQ